LIKDYLDTEAKDVSIIELRLMKDWMEGTKSYPFHIEILKRQREIMSQKKMPILERTIDKIIV